MDAYERGEELGNALGSIYRVRMATTYDELGQAGVAEIVLAEVLVARAIRRSKGEPVGGLPRYVRDMREELQAGRST